MIRTATRADVPEIVDLGERHWNESAYGQWMRADREAMASLARAALDTPNALVLVDERETGLVGIIGVVAMPHVYTGVLVMSELFWYVEPEARGSGVRLLKEAEAWAADNGVQFSTMMAPDERVAQFLGRIGYAPVETHLIKRL